MFKRIRLKISGIVQGVGFRPYIYGLAKKHNLSGWVRNGADGIVIEIEGTKTNEFISALSDNNPPNSTINKIEYHEIEPAQEKQFTILESQTSRGKSSIAADISICPDCLEDLFNPESCYYLYPFVSCSHCGPRYSITQQPPYDRANTTMARFKMCPTCADQYHSPINRRFHAQTIACPTCGPQLSMPTKQIIQLIKQGKILAIKGIGGFHLVCDANNDSAVKRLRQQKHRDEKPLAVMVANLASAKQLAHINDTEIKLLQNQQRPIVVLSKKDKPNISNSVAPDLKWLGVMLPYTPLHYLLFHQAAGEPKGTAWLEQTQSLCLVVTSANRVGEPLIIDGNEAKQDLTGIADAIIDHDRQIVVRCDDSVMRVINNQPGFIRRSRGYAPQAIKLPYPIPSTLAVGGQLKNTICITRDDEAFISQHIGDMDNTATLRFFEETIEQLLSVLNVKPERVAHDLHPDFRSTHYAQSMGLPCYAVQHHHAHLAAVAAEHHITDPAIGLALDGFGLGTNHTAWGGELCLIDGIHFQRLGHLRPLKQPGGDIAAREPWRMAASLLHQIGRKDEIAARYHTQAAARNINQLLQKNINSPSTTSCGRLFDTASGLINIKHKTSFEGQAAMLLESLVTEPTVMKNGWLIEDNQLDLTALLTALIDCEATDAANLFHGTLIEALCEWATQATETYKTKKILLSGGCFLNQVLANGVMKELQARQLKPYLPQQAPANDGGISLGQVWVAGNI